MITITKEELFKKYNIDESHSIWTDADRYYLIELYRYKYKKLPDKDDNTDLSYITEFIDTSLSNPKVSIIPNFGSMYLTAKRAIYLFHNQILDELNGKK